jgi:hypothetical protein
MVPHTHLKSSNYKEEKMKGTGRKRGQQHFPQALQYQNIKQEKIPI